MRGCTQPDLGQGEARVSSAGRMVLWEPTGEPVQQGGSVLGPQGGGDGGEGGG